MPFIELGKFPGETARPVWTALQDRGGYIHAQEIVLAGGTKGVIRSQNYVPSTSGWAIYGDGSAELQNVIVRGTLNADDITAGTLSVDRIAANSLGTVKFTDTLQSDNFVSGTSGWQITIDTGNAEFNDILIRGDLESGNWDGTSPANLATEDTGATAGFYLDASVGAAQFEGSIWLGGDLEMTGTGSVIRSADTNSDRIEIGGGDAYLKMYADFLGSSILHAVVGYAATGYGANDLTISTESNSDNMVLAPDGGLYVKPGGTSGYGQIIEIVHNDLGGIPSYPLACLDTTTREYFVVSDRPQALVGDTGTTSNPSWSWWDDDNTGLYRPAADQMGLVAGGVEMLRLVEGTSDYIDVLKELRFTAYEGATHEIGVQENQGISLDLGRTDGTNATPFIDFHGGDDVDYNVRLLAQGNQSGLAGGGLAVYGTYLKLASSGATFYFGADSDTYLVGGGADEIDFYSGGNQVFTVGATDRVTVHNEIYGTSAMGTTGSYNTLRWHSSTYQFLRFTSSKRYKKNIRALGSRPDDLDPDIILSLRPTISDDRIDRNSAPDKQVPGFIAEEVFELDQRLAVFDENGEVEAYDESKMNVLLIAQVQKLAARIDELESQLV